jgi:hypothetical protein
MDPDSLDVENCFWSRRMRRIDQRTASPNANRTIVPTMSLCVGSVCCVIRGNKTFMTTSEEVWANMALSRPKLQNSQPYTTPGTPLWMMIRITPIASIGMPHWRAQGRCPRLKRMADRIPAIHNCQGAGRPVWLRNILLPRKASSDSKNRR